MQSHDPGARHCFIAPVSRLSPRTMILLNPQIFSAPTFQAISIAWQHDIHFEPPFGFNAPSGYTGPPGHKIVKLPTEYTVGIGKVQDDAHVVEARNGEQFGTFVLCTQQLT